MNPYLAALICVVAFVVLPGMAVASILTRRVPADDRTPERFAAYALAAGMSVWILGGRLLVRFGALSRGPALVAIACLTVGSVVALVGPGRPGISAVWSRTGASFAAWAAGSTVVGAAPLLRLLAGRTDSFINPTPWYYWDLVRQTVMAHGDPAHSFEWGTRVAFLNDYPGFTAGTGVLAVLRGTSTFAAAHLVQAIAILAGGLAMFLLVRAFGGSRPGAALGTVLFFTLDIAGTKLSSFRPEALGYAVMLLLPVLALEWLRERHAGALVLTAVTFVALSQTHAIDAMFGAALLAGTVVATMRFGSGARRWLVGAGVLTAVVVLCWTVGNVGLGGNLSGAAEAGGIPSVRHGVDPTWQFFHNVQAPTPAIPPTVKAIADGSLHRGFVGLTSVWLAALAAVIVLALVLRAIIARRPEDRSSAREVLALLVVTTVVVVAICFVFALNWQTFVPRRTGFGRLLQMLPIILPVGAGVVVGGAAVATDSGARRRIAAIVPALAMIIALVVLGHGVGDTDALKTQQPPRDTLGALRDLKLPRDAEVLTNSYSEGIVPVAAGARGVLDGRAPYTDPKLLTRANSLLAASRNFFIQPGAPLPCRGITHVLVATDAKWRLATPSLFPTDYTALDRRPDLELESTGPGFRLYRVVRGGERASSVRQPALRCDPSGRRVR
ncbi:MAG TPA: hypothetical protein VF441_07735 [Acidimicrobiia bacterium]